MKRTCLLSTAAILATLAISSVAHAETKPAILWVPLSDVEATPSGTVDSICQKTGMSGSAVAAGCLPNVADASTLSPSESAMEISEGIAAAFAAYDLRVVNDPPPAYVPVYALFTGAEASKENNSYSCTSAVTNCAALGRDAAYFAFLDGTNNCSDPDVVAAGVFAAGLLSGLEGKEAGGTDWMSYPPDFTTPGTEFVDECGAIAAPLGGEDGMTKQPLDCTSLDHEGCSSMEQNSHADLLENLGPNAPDGDAPVIAITSLSDGDVIAEGSPITVEATVEEASNFAAVRITLASESLDGFPGITGGEFTFCTTDICDENFLDGAPFKTADSGWSTGDINGFPGGEYTITLEASDYYGNEAEAVTITVTLEGTVDPTGGDDTDSGDPTTDPTTDPSGDPSGDPTFVSGDSSGGGGDTDDGGGDGGATDDGGGCSVGTSGGIGGSFAMMLGLLGLGLLRRRD